MYFNKEKVLFFWELDMGQWAWVDKTAIALDIKLDLCTFQQHSLKSFCYLIN